MPSPSKLREWSDFNANGGDASKEWWAAYAVAYETASKWARKAQHAPFCYELLVSMLALASREQAGPPGTQFATKERRERLLLLLASGCAKKDGPLRPTCVSLSATLVTSMPIPTVKVRHLARTTPSPCPSLTCHALR